MSRRAAYLRGLLPSVLALSIASAPAAAQTADPPPPSTPPETPEASAQPATLSDLAWPAGDFEGLTPDGALNETRFMPPRAGVMTGMMRLSKDGDLWIQELFVLREAEDGGVEMRLRHFDGELAAIEKEPYVLRLASWDGTRALFEPVGESVIRWSTVTRTDAGWDGETEIVGADGGAQVIRSSFRRVR